MSRGPRWQSLRRQVFERDGYRCRSCGKAGRLDCDHVLPLDKGGEPWSLGNLQSLCRPCHVDKTASENSKGQIDPRSWAILKSSRRSWALFRDELVTESHRVENFFVPVSLLFATTIFSRFMDLSI